MAWISPVSSAQVRRRRESIGAPRRPRGEPGRALAEHRARRGVAAEGRLSSSTGFSGRVPAGFPTALFRPRPAPLGIAFALTVIWFVLNDQHPSPLDVLPFAWTWLTLWLALSVALELWRRNAPPLPTRRHRRA